MVGNFPTVNSPEEKQGRWKIAENEMQAGDK